VIGRRHASPSACVVTDSSDLGAGHDSASRVLDEPGQAGILGGKPQNTDAN
jgi:hypothetical protein